MNLTDEQKQKLIAALKTFGGQVFSALIALAIAALAIFNAPQPVSLSQPGGIGTLATNQKIVADRAGSKLTVLSGGTLQVDSGATETHAGTTTWTGALAADGGITVDTTNFIVHGTTGAVTTASSLTAASAAIGGGYSSTGCDISSAGALQCSGASTIDNLTTTNITGTLATAAQPNITSVGTLATATVTDLTTTNITGTLATATQASVTSLGTLSALTVSGLTKLTASSTITVTNGAPFAVTSGMNEITAASEVTPTLTIPAAGVLACLYNSGTNVIHLADASNQVLSAQWDAGQYDTLCLWSDGTRAISISRSDN